MICMADCRDANSGPAMAVLCIGSMMAGAVHRAALPREKAVWLALHTGENTEMGIKAVVKEYPALKYALILALADDADALAISSLISKELHNHGICVISLLASQSDAVPAEHQRAAEQLRAAADLQMFFPHTGEEELIRTARCLVIALEEGSTISLDFEDIRAVFGDGGSCYTGTFRGLRAFARVAGPLPDATGVLGCILSPMDASLEEIHDIISLVQKFLNPDAIIMWALAFDEGIDGVDVTLIMTRGEK